MKDDDGHRNDTGVGCLPNIARSNACLGVNDRQLETSNCGEARAGIRHRGIQASASGQTWPGPQRSGDMLFQAAGVL